MNGVRVLVRIDRWDYLTDGVAEKATSTNPETLREAEKKAEEEATT